MLENPFLFLDCIILLWNNNPLKDGSKYWMPKIQIHRKTKQTVVLYSNGKTKWNPDFWFVFQIILMVTCTTGCTNHRNTKHITLKSGSLFTHLKPPKDGAQIPSANGLWMVPTCSDIRKQNICLFFYNLPCHVTTLSWTVLYLNLILVNTCQHLNPSAYR